MADTLVRGWQAGDKVCYNTLTGSCERCGSFEMLPSDPHVCPMCSAAASVTVHRKKATVGGVVSVDNVVCYVRIEFPTGGGLLVQPEELSWAPKDKARENV